jgi:DNA modification methylase
MDIRNCDGRDLLNTLDDGSVDLILTDPPYIISHETNALHDAIESGKNMTELSGRPIVKITRWFERYGQGKLHEIRNNLRNEIQCEDKIW